MPRDTIDDALGKLGDSEENQQQQETQEQPSQNNITFPDEITKIIASYPHALAQTIVVEGGPKWNKFNSAAIRPFARYIRFDNQLSAQILPIPRNELIDIMCKLLITDSDKRYLLTETDVGNSIPDPFYITRKTSYENCPDCLGLPEVLGRREFEKFASNSANYFIIPDAAFMSLFIAEGEKLRKYARTIQESPENIFVLKLNNISLNPYIKFTAESLKKFCESTGIKDVAGMIDQVTKLQTLMKTWCDTNSKDSARNMLYTRLKGYHPNLTV